MGFLLAGIWCYGFVSFSLTISTENCLAIKCDISLP
jgi:hypothetical protein